MQPVPLHVPDALAFTATDPAAPGLHCATPFELIVAIVGSDTDHPDGVTGDGEGGSL